MSLIAINLLPSGEIRRTQSRRALALRIPRVPALNGDPWIASLAGAGLLLLLVFAFTFWRTGVRQGELQTRIEGEVADSARLASAIQLVETLRARQDTITQKIAIIRDVDQRRYTWPHLLDEISMSVPAFTWLSNLSSTVSSDSINPGPSITLQGNAGSTQALTRLMKNLEASPFLQGITLVTTEQASEEGRTFQRFTLEAQYETPDPSRIETIPVIAIP